MQHPPINAEPHPPASAPPHIASQELRVVPASSWEDAARILPDWDALLDDSPTRTVFLTREWLTSWWQAYSSGEDVRLLFCLDASGQVVGVLPLFCTQWKAGPGLNFRVLRFVGDGTYDSDNLSIIVRPDLVSASIRAWLDWLGRHREEWDVLELNTLPAESSVTLEIQKEIRHRGWSVLAEMRPHALLMLPGDWPAYLKILSGNMRSSIESRTRKLEKQHRVEFLRCTRVEDLPGSLDALFHLHQKRWEARGESGAMKKDGRRELFSLSAEKMLTRGALDLWTLKADDQIVAVEIGFRFGDTESFLQGGFDTDWSAKSVGLVLKGYILKNLIEAGIKQYDFLGGGEDYKLRWGAELRGYVHMKCAPSGSLAGIYLSSVRTARNTKEWARARVPQSAWDFIRRKFRTMKPLDE